MSKPSNYLPIAGLLLTLLMLFPAAVWAGGLWLSEFGSPSMGTAGSGSAALANDASTALHNPAGMARIDGRLDDLAGHRPHPGGPGSW